MAKFRDIAKGTLARRPFPFPMTDGSVAQVALRGLFGENPARVLKGAREFAVSRGVPEPMDGDELYELGKRVHTILLGVTDIDSPDENPEPFFGSIAEILDDKRGLDPDRIILLYEAQQAFQDEISPSPKTMDIAEFSQQVMAHALASEDARELPFESMPPGMRRTFVRTMAVMLANSLGLKSSPTLGSPDDGTSGTKSSSGLASGSEAN